MLSPSTATAYGGTEFERVIGGRASASPSSLFIIIYIFECLSQARNVQPQSSCVFKKLSGATAIATIQPLLETFGKESDGNQKSETRLLNWLPHT